MANLFKPACGYCQVDMRKRAGIWFCVNRDCHNFKLSWESIWWEK